VQQCQQKTLHVGHTANRDLGDDGAKLASSHGKLFNKTQRKAEVAVRSIAHQEKFLTTSTNWKKHD